MTIPVLVGLRQLFAAFLEPVQSFFPLTFRKACNMCFPTRFSLYLSAHYAGAGQPHAGAHFQPGICACARHLALQLSRDELTLIMV